MRTGGLVLAVVGVLIIIVALVNHFVANFTGSLSHGTIILGVVGVVVLLIGGFLSTRSAAS
jgi:hypothetical protein